MSVCFGASLRIVNVNVDGGVRSHLFMSPDNNNDLFTKTFEFLLFIFLTLEMITYVQKYCIVSEIKIMLRQEKCWVCQIHFYLALALITNI